MDWSRSERAEIDFHIDRRDKDITYMQILLIIIYWRENESMALEEHFAIEVIKRTWKIDSFKFSRSRYYSR